MDFVDMLLNIFLNLIIHETYINLDETLIHKIMNDENIKCCANCTHAYWDDIEVMYVCGKDDSIIYEEDIQYCDEFTDYDE